MTTMEWRYDEHSNEWYKVVVNADTKTSYEIRYNVPTDDSITNPGDDERKGEPQS